MKSFKLVSRGEAWGTHRTLIKYFLVIAYVVLLKGIVRRLFALQLVIFLGHTDRFFMRLALFLVYHSNDLLDLEQFLLNSHLAVLKAVIENYFTEVVWLFIV